MVIVVSITFSLWFILTVLNQFGWSWFVRLLKFDFLHILPVWTFFAPNPGVRDNHVVYRDYCPATQSYSDWSEVLFERKRHFFSFLWSPEKRRKKLLADVVSALIQLRDIQKDDPRLVVVSGPYLILLNLVLRFDGTKSDQRQFAIVETQGFITDTNIPNVVMISERHEI